MVRFRRRRMRLRRPVKRWKIIAVTVLFLLVFISLQTFTFLEYNLRPAFLQIAENYTRKVATEAINEAVTSKVAEETDYRQIVQFFKDDRGNVRSAVFNMSEANRIKAQTTNRVQSILREIEEKEIRLPVGQALHSSILAALGPDIPIKIMPMGTAKSDIEEDSETLGINQTKYSLKLNIHVQINVIIPFVTKPMDIETQIPIASIIMVGEVPQFFFDARGAPFVPSGMPAYPFPAPAAPK